MEINRMKMNGEYASFKTGGRWRVQERFEGGRKWSLIDDWYGIKVLDSDSYEDAFKAIADYEDAVREENKKIQLKGLDTLNRVAEVIGAEVTIGFAGSKDINEKYKICIAREYYEVHKEKRARVQMSLVRKDRKNEAVATKYVEDGCSDRAIMNRYNKLMAEIEA